MFRRFNYILPVDAYLGTLWLKTWWLWGYWMDKSSSMILREKRLPKHCKQLMKRYCVSSGIPSSTTYLQQEVSITLFGSMIQGPTVTKSSNFTLTESGPFSGQAKFHGCWLQVLMTPSLLCGTLETNSSSTRLRSPHSHWPLLQLIPTDPSPIFRAISMQA